MRTVTSIAAVLALVLIGSGCTAGIIYTHTVEPLTLDHRATPAVGTGSEGNIKHIQLSYVGIKWGDTSLGDIARENGLRELYYADVEHLNILTVWRQSTVHLYGK